MLIEQKAARYLKANGIKVSSFGGQLVFEMPDKAAPNGPSFTAMSAVRWWRRLLALVRRRKPIDVDSLIA